MRVAGLRVGYGPWLAASDVGRLEALKWLAFAAMVIDHAALAWPGSVPIEARLIGRFAFPVFCLTFGLGLAQSSSPGQVAARLLLPGVLAQVAWVFVQTSHPVNMLLVFAACAAAVQLYRSPRWWWTAGFLLGPVCVFGEGMVFSVALVFAGMAAGAHRTVWPILLSGLAWWFVAPSIGVVVAVVAVAVWSSEWPRVPRIRGLLAWGYALHLLGFGALVAAGVGK